MIIAVLALTTGVYLMPAQAEESNETVLKRQLEEVQQQLHELQLKVQRMESELGAVQAPAHAVVTPSTANRPAPAPVQMETGSSPSAEAVPDAFQWREMLKEQWHGVKAGMSGKEIEELLGTPSREFTLDGRPVWYYTYPGIGNGSVIFGRDDHSVADWQRPPFGFW